MKQNNILAMILAGGRGTRLHDLTNKVAKPRFHTAENTVSSIFHSPTAPTVELILSVCSRSMNRSC